MAPERDCICERSGYTPCFLCTLTPAERTELRELNKWQKGTDMPRKPSGARPLTTAERQARHRAQRAVQTEAMQLALERIVSAKTVKEAREIAASALGLR